MCGLRQGQVWGYVTGTKIPALRKQQIPQTMGRGGKDLVTPIAGGRETTGKPTDSKHCALSQRGKSQREPPTSLLREWHQALLRNGEGKGWGGKEKKRGQKEKSSVCHLLFNLRKVRTMKEVFERQTGWLLQMVGSQTGRWLWVHGVVGRAPLV